MMRPDRALTSRDSAADYQRSILSAAGIDTARFQRGWERLGPSA